MNPAPVVPLVLPVFAVLLLPAKLVIIVMLIMPLLLFFSWAALLSVPYLILSVDRLQRRESHHVVNIIFWSVFSCFFSIIIVFISSN
jgi:hypothetical protein